MESNKSIIDSIVDYSKSNLDLANARLADEYYYHSLPHCIVDAVYSISAPYTSTQNTVQRYCDYFGLPIFSTTKNRPQVSKQLSVDEFILKCVPFTDDELATHVFQNRQRTSARNGILKASAVRQFATVLQQHNVNYYQDVLQIIGNQSFEDDITKIPGQRSGISTRYFYMLAGSDDYIKPDRMVGRFIFAATHQTLSISDIHNAIIGAFTILVSDYPHLTPRALDNQIWQYQRKQ